MPTDTQGLLRKFAAARRAAAALRFSTGSG
jgi:hypothetical protein